VEEEAVPERALAGIVWRQQDPTVVELAFEDGGTETVTGTHADATRMAREAGLQTAPSPLGTTRWARGGQRSSGRTPKRIGPWLSN
jgi:hypothetical protein